MGQIIAGGEQFETVGDLLQAFLLITHIKPQFLCLNSPS